MQASQEKKSYYHGRLIGFEVESINQTLKEEDEIPASSEKIGTITFVKEATNEFVALGHSTIKEKNQNVGISGTCYNIEFEGINKGTKGETGNIIAALDKMSHLGYIRSDSDYGISGRIDEIDDKYIETEIGRWFEVKRGKASMVMALNGNKLKSYEVEIVGVDYISKNKNIKIKVLDEELLELSGGVVQGMSGTPLVQDGKLIGAVNYVSADDPTDAYAVFVEKLL